MSWTPIAPDLHNGVFESLQGIEGLVGAEPVDLDVEPFGSLKTLRAERSTFVASQLGVAKIVDLELAYESRSLVRDTFAYSESPIVVANDRPIIQTMWGAGVRVRVDFSSLDSRLEINLGALAAAASLGLVKASYEVVGIGIADPTILGLLPGPGPFNLESLGKIEKAVDEIEKAALIPKKNLRSVPFQVRFSRGFEHVAAPISSRSKARLYAIRQIEKQKTLDDAVAWGIRIGLDEVEITKTYKEFWADPQKPPSDRASSRADAWLDVVNL